MVGCLLDLDARPFSLNGKDLGAAFVGIDFSASGLRIAPAASFNVTSNSIQLAILHSHSHPSNDAQPSIRPVSRRLQPPKQLTGSLDPMGGDGVPSELDERWRMRTESSESANASGGAAVAVH